MAEKKKKKPKKRTPKYDKKLSITGALDDVLRASAKKENNK